MEENWDEDCDSTPVVKKDDGLQEVCSQFQEMGRTNNSHSNESESGSSYRNYKGRGQGRYSEAQSNGGRRGRYMTEWHGGQSRGRGGYNEKQFRGRGRNYGSQNESESQYNYSKRDTCNTQDSNSGSGEGQNFNRVGKQDNYLKRNYDSRGDSWGQKPSGNSWRQNSSDNSWGQKTSDNSWGQKSSDNSLGQKSSGNTWDQKSSGNTWDQKSSGNTWDQKSSDNSWGQKSSDSSWDQKSSANNWDQKSSGNTCDQKSSGNTCDQKSSGNTWDQKSSGNNLDKNSSKNYSDQMSSNNTWDQRSSNTSWDQRPSSNFRDQKSSESTWDHKSSGNNKSSNNYSQEKERNEGLTEDGLIDWDFVSERMQEREHAMFAHLPDVIKNTYKESKEVAALTPSEVKAFRLQNNRISVTSLEDKELKVLNPVRTFADAFKPYPAILKLIEDKGFETPSPIQCQLWPLLMSGYDMVGIAQTGTGKTLAYLLPALLHMEAQPYFKSRKRTGPLCLVLAPTRELAQQIKLECTKFTYKATKIVCVYGQGDRNEQKRALQSIVDIVVATPGRLIDFVNSDIVDLAGVSYLVLDEADRMLDMGFQPDILKITSHIRKDRQTVLTSATWPADVEYIAKRLMKDAMKVNVGDLDLAAVGTVTQHIRICEEDDKFELLAEVLQDLAPDDKIIVFANRKATVDYCSMFLLDYKIPVGVMHGGVAQSDREQALEDLRTGYIKVLAATDVASRGLDVQDLTKVINFDLPKNLEEYVHRAGRTGRAGKTGEVLSFVTWDDRRNVQQLIEILQRSDQVIPDELEQLRGRAQRFMERNPRPTGGRGQNRFRGGMGSFF